jgi:4-hydroxybenzoate polyprenyltransferase
MRHYVNQLRPRQWVKNLILFAGVIFAEQLLDVALLLRALSGFAVFCMLSSAVYCLNDIADLAADRMHPQKRSRPLASGAISKGSVATMGAVLLVGGLAGAYLLAPTFALVAVLYLVNNIAYSFGLKRLPIVDVIAIATGFVLRAVGSVEVLARDAVLISPWLLLCTFFLALFIGAGKRRAELALLADDASEHRVALAGYSVPFLDRILSTAMTTAIISYAIYTLAPSTQSKFNTHQLVYTVPFVVYGLLRYMYIVYEKERGGNPTEAILHDVPLRIAVLLWVSTVCYVLYVVAAPAR